MSHSTHDRSFQKQSSQPITRLVQKPAFLANQLAGTSKTNVTITTLQHKNHTTITKKLLTHTKLNLTELKPGSGRLLRHPARKQIGPIL